jgi:hypothetical protein
VLGSALLSSGLVERLVGSEDLKVQLGKPAWTLWPGHFHVPFARILVNGTTQFKLEASNLVIELELFPLIKRHLHVRSLVGDGIRYWMRVQVKDPKGIEKRLAAYAVLNDLPGDPTVVERQAQQTEPRQSDFTVEVDGIDVRVEELWFMEYHYLGKGTLKGSFLVGPHRMRVGTSVQNLGPGQLRFGATTPLVDHFRGHIQASIPDLNPEEHADTSFLELVSSDIELHGDIVSLGPLSAYTGKIRLTDGAGALDTLLHLSKGALGDGSYFRFTSDRVGLRETGFGIDTDWHLDARVAGENGKSELLPRATSTSQATYVSVSNSHGKIFTVQVLGHEEDVTLRSPQLGRMTDIEHARVHLPRIVTNDLHDLGALTADGPPVDARSGQARASLDLDVDAHHVARGPFEASFDGLALTAGGVQVAGRGGAKGKVHAELDKKSASVRDVSLTIQDVDVRAGDRTERGFWTTANVPYFGVTGNGKIEGRLSVRSKNAAPLLDVLVAKDQLTSLVPKITSLPDLRVRAEFRKDQDVTDVFLEPVENTLFDVAGRFYSKGDRSRFAMVVGGKVVSLGLAKETGSSLSLMPFAREGWLNEHLARFPAPVRRIESSQP